MKIVKSEFDFRVLQSNDGSNKYRYALGYIRAGVVHGFYSKWSRSRILTKVLKDVKKGRNSALLSCKITNRPNFEDGKKTKICKVHRFLW